MPSFIALLSQIVQCWIITLKYPSSCCVLQSTQTLRNTFYYTEQVTGYSYCQNMCLWQVLPANPSIRVIHNMILLIIRAHRRLPYTALTKHWAVDSSFLLRSKSSFVFKARFQNLLFAGLVEIAPQTWWTKIRKEHSIWTCKPRKKSRRSKCSRMLPWSKELSYRWRMNEVHFHFNFQ